MRMRTLQALAATAGLSLAAAFVSLAIRPGSPAPQPPAETRLFPALATRANDVADIRVVQGGETATLVRFGDRWVLAEKGGFPVHLDRIRDVVAGLAALSLSEPRTDQPDRHARLDLDDPEQPGARGRLLEVRTAQGEPLARLVVGRAAAAPVSPGRPAVYVRRVDDNQAWLADGPLDLPRTPVDWLDRRLADFGPDHVRALAWTAPGRPPLVLARTAPGSFEFQAEVDGQPRRTDAAGGQALARLLSGLAFDDVRPSDEVRFDGAPVADVQTFDGLRIRFELADADGATWARIAAGVAPVRVGSVPVTTIGAMAAAFTERAQGWAFRLPPARTDVLRDPARLLSGPRS